MNQLDLEDYTGIKLQRIKNISSGRVDGFKGDDLNLLVHKLHLNPEWLTIGEGDIFKEGFGRSFPSVWEFVTEVINRMVRIVEPVFYAPIADDVLNLPTGTVSKWIKDGKIPYWFLKAFAKEYSTDIDTLLYGRSENTPYENKVELNQNVQQETIIYNHLTEREQALMGGFRVLSDKEKSAVETLILAITKSKLK